MAIKDELDHAIRLREAAPGRPENGPYPATVGEVADEVIAWLREMDGTSARGLLGEVFLKLDERRAKGGK